MIKAILFDIDDTLLDFTKNARSSIFYTCKEFNVPFSSELLDEFFKATAISWRKIEDGIITRAQLRETRWKMVFDKLNIDCNGVEFEDYFKLQLNESHEEVDGALETIKYLYNKCDLYCASNAPSNQQEQRLEAAGMLPYFKGLFISGDTGLYKPNADFFDNCFKSFPTLTKDEVLMVGDDIYADIKGAVEYGIKTCYFNKHNKKEVIAIKPTYTITSITDLKNLF